MTTTWHGSRKCHNNDRKTITRNDPHRLFFCSGGQLLRVSVCITPPSMQNVTTSSFKNIKDENKLNPARMLSGNVPRTPYPTSTGFGTGNSKIKHFAYERDFPRKFCESKFSWKISLSQAKYFILETTM